MARRKQALKGKQFADQAVALAEYAANALVVAQQLRIKTKAIERLLLDEAERATLAELTALTAKTKKKLANKEGSFTVAEVAGMVMAVAESFVDAHLRQQLALLLVTKKLVECLQANIVMRMPAPARR